MIVVAGIARSGLTATMQMLNAGGYPCVGEYPAFEHYGIGEVKWGACEGMAVKLVDSQLQLPPKKTKCKIILLSRDLNQQAKSTNKFLGGLGFQHINESSLVRSLKKDYAIIYKWASKQSTFVLRFEDIINTPRDAAEWISSFTGRIFNIDKMAGVIIDRKPECHPTLLEIGMIQ